MRLKIELALFLRALLHRGRSTSPTTEQLARDVPERSEDEARPVTGAVHAGSSRRDSFAGAAGAGRSRTHDSAERWRAACRGRGAAVPGGRAGVRPDVGTYGLATSNDWKPTGLHVPTVGRTYPPGFQALEAGTDALNRRSGLRIVPLEEGSDIGKEPRPFPALRLYTINGVTYSERFSETIPNVSYIGFATQNAETLFTEPEIRP